MTTFKENLTIFIGITALVACKSPGDPFRELSKIEGAWEMKFEGGSAVVETWEKINDTLYAGKSYEVTGGDSVLTENVQLVKSNGNVFYIPTVLEQNNRQPVSFKLTRHEGDTFIFENPQHDFPTMITYLFKGNDSLSATISGTIKGELRQMDFEYARTAE